MSVVPGNLRARETFCVFSAVPIRARYGENRNEFGAVSEP